MPTDIENNMNSENNTIAEDNLSSSHLRDYRHAAAASIPDSAEVCSYLFIFFPKKKTTNKGFIRQK